MVTVTDRPDITMDVFSNKAQQLKTDNKARVNNYCTTTVTIISAALCATDDLPRKSF